MSAPRQRIPFKRVYSSGGVVYRLNREGIEIVVCGRKASGVWALPKGTPRIGESLQETAAREVEEETGLKVTIEEQIGQVQYWFVEEGVHYFKTVYYFLMRPAGGDMADHDPEFDEVLWLAFDKALGVLTYDNDLNIVRRAGELVLLRSGKEDSSV